MGRREAEGHQCQGAVTGRFWFEDEREHRPSVGGGGNRAGPASVVPRLSLASPQLRCPV